MILKQLLANHILHAALIAWSLAQFLKVLIDIIRHHRLDWRVWSSPGGMPSSHSSLICATAIAIGLFEGFDTPLFALATAIAMIVTYDAAGVRRQAGMQAQRINQIINEVLTGHPLSDQALQEVLGHTPLQVLIGFLLGTAVGVVTWLIWK
jgi:uncharacterized protein